MDLVAPYSKRQDLADGLVRTVQRLHKAQERSDDQPVSVRSTGRSQRQWQVSDRLTDVEIRRLAQAFACGTPKWKLAEQYGISESSVKRLLRRHRAKA